MTTKQITNWVPSVLVMVFIFVLSSLDGRTINSNGLGNEALHINGHFFMYTVLYLSLYKALGNSYRAMFLAFIYSLTDEFHQKFVPGRSAGMFDIVVDNLGILLGSLIVWKLYPHLPKKLKSLLTK